MERQAKDGTVYKLIGQDEWEPITRTAKDGTVYKKTGPDAWSPLEQQKDDGPSAFQSAVRKGLQGATAGFSDEIGGAVEAAGRVFGVKGAGGPLSEMSLQGPTVDPDELKSAYIQARNQERSNLKKDIETNPVVSTAAEIGGGFLNPANRVVQGASALKQGAALGAMSGLGSSESDTAMGDVESAVTGGLTGAAIGKVADKIGGALAPKLNKSSEDMASKISAPIAKENKDQIISAADRLGIKLTPAMLDETGFVQRLEYTLANSPSVFGQKINRQQKEAYSKLQNAIGAATKEATNLEPYQVGERVKSGIAAKIGERLDPVSDVFNQVKQSTEFIPVSNKSKEAVIRNIQNTREFKLTGGGKAQEFVDMLERAESADDIKTITTLLNQELRSPSISGIDKTVLGAVKQKLANLEENSITRAAIDQARNGGMTAATGKKIGKEIVGDLKDARTAYREILSDIESTSLDARLGKSYGPSGFIDNVEGIPSEKIQQRFFNADNQRQIENLAKNFPDEFELLRQGKIKDVLDSSLDATDNISVQKFVKEVKKLSPTVKGIVFSGNTSLIDDVATLRNVLPKDFNPSGTGSQMNWREAIYSNVKDVPTWMLYKGASTNLGKKVGNVVSGESGNEILKAAESGVKSLAAPATRYATNKNPEKGPDKWANDGLSVVSQSGLNLNQGQIDSLMSDKKGKDLLIQASSLPKGSKAMGEILQKIQSLDAYKTNIESNSDNVNK